MLSSALYFDVYLGAHNVRVTEPTRLEIRATEKYIHPNWNSATLNGDIALIKLPAPVDISGGKPILHWDNNIEKINYFAKYEWILADLVRPICLQDPTDTDLYVGAEANIAGWGKTADGKLKAWINEIVAKI